MPTQFSPNNPLDVGLLGGIRGYQRDQQQEQQFNTEMAQAQQNLFAKSLEIQDFIEGQKLRETKRRVGTKKLESEERMLPVQEATDKATMQAQQIKAKLASESYKNEEMARPLFNITPENYEETIRAVPDEVKNILGLTGSSWAEDGATITQARRTAVDTAAHMRALDLLDKRAELSKGSGGNIKAKAINLAKKNLLIVDQLLKNDEVYGNLGGDAQASYRANIAAVAQDLYQQNVDQVRNGQRSDLIPFSTYISQVKGLADTYAEKEGIWSGILNTRNFNAQGFNNAVAEQFGINVSPEVVQELSGPVEDEPVAKEGITLPDKTKRAVENASSIIQQAREEQGISDTTPDFLIFNKLVEIGYLNKDGSLAKKKPTIYKIDRSRK